MQITTLAPKIQWKKRKKRKRRRKWKKLIRVLYIIVSLIKVKFPTSPRRAEKLFTIVA